MAFPNRNAFRQHPLDGALLQFHPASGTNIRIENETTRHLQRQAPRVVMFGITNKCNLACDFCSRDTTRDSLWTVPTAVAVLRDLSAAGTLEVAFGGGEPFAFRGFQDLVRELYTTTSLVLNVTTNGTLIQKKNFAAYLGCFGQVRVSIYENSTWRDACAALSHHGQRWGANLIVDNATLPYLPSLLAELTALGCHDASLLSYIGPDFRKHLRAGERAGLADIIDDSPLPCRLSVCFGDSVPVPRLFDGIDGSSDCGAGLDFVSITPDQRMQGCSFHDAGFPAKTAEEILQGWNTKRARLMAASERQGCARRTPHMARSRSVPAINVWQAFSGNNSGECIMVAKFATIEDADAYLTQLLPGWMSEKPYAAAWRDLLITEGIAAAPISEWKCMPTELAAIGRSVIAIDYGLDDSLADLRALAWKQGAYLAPGGYCVNHFTMLAAVRNRNEEDGRMLMSQTLHPAAQAYLHGDVILITVAMMAKTYSLDLANVQKILADFAGPRPLAVEVVFRQIDQTAMIAVKKRLGAATSQKPRLCVRFYGNEAAAKAGNFARLVDADNVITAGTCVLISGIKRRKRLAILAYQREAYVDVLDDEAVQIHASLVIPNAENRKGKKKIVPAIDIAAVDTELRRQLVGDFHTKVTRSDHWNSKAYVKIQTPQPEQALPALAATAQAFGAILNVNITEIDPLAAAVRRVIAEAKQ